MTPGTPIDCPAVESTGDGRAQDPAASAPSPVVRRRAARASVPGRPAVSGAPHGTAGGRTSAAVLDLALSAAADPSSPQLSERPAAGGPDPGAGEADPAAGNRLPASPGRGRTRAPAPVTRAVPDRVAARVRAPDKTPAGGAPASTQATSALSAGSRAIAAAMSEDRGPDSLEAHLRRLMKGLGLWGYHPRRSEKSEKGWPDWAIIGTRIIYRELKTERGKVTDEQEAVGQRITRAGGDWDVWRPRDLLSGRVAEELRAITAGPLGHGGAA